MIKKISSYIIYFLFKPSVNIVEYILSLELLYGHFKFSDDSLAGALILFCIVIIVAVIKIFYDLKERGVE